MPGVVRLAMHVEVEEASACPAIGGAGRTLRLLTQFGIIVKSNPFRRIRE